jgi:hypothetical protein
MRVLLPVYAGFGSTPIRAAQNIARRAAAEPRPGPSDPRPELMT